MALKPLISRMIQDSFQSSSNKPPLEIIGWIKSIRKQKNYTFGGISDGSLDKPLQFIIDSKNPLNEKLHLGACVRLLGEINKCEPNREQFIEMSVQSGEVVGDCNPEIYPLQKKFHSVDFLRSIPHLRVRTESASQILKLRSFSMKSFHDYLHRNGFTLVNTPLITSNDCEGGGEVFQIGVPSRKSKETKENQIEKLDLDFFGTDPAYLTVSGQLHAEALAASLGRVYTFGPIFRAEQSHSSKHLAEFWMLEGEIAFIESLDELLSHIQDMLLDNLQSLVHRFSFMLESMNPSLQDICCNGKDEFKRISYSDAIEMLKHESKHSNIQWGDPFCKDAEIFLARNGPIFVTDYPTALKPFYMKQNNDGDTVACVDLLMPGMGEILGGSLREDNIDKLKNAIMRMKIENKENEPIGDRLNWYWNDLRRFGSFPHGGYGLGFERWIQFISASNSIKDVIPFPRSARKLMF